MTPWDVLTERLDPRLVHLEVDLYWAYTGGVNTGAADPLAFANDVIRSAPQEVRQYHVKDRHGADAARSTTRARRHGRPRPRRDRLPGHLQEAPGRGVHRGERHPGLPSGGDRQHGLPLPRGPRPSEPVRQPDALGPHAVDGVGPDAASGRPAALWTARGGDLGMWRYGCGAEQHSARNKREQSEVAKLVIVESPAKARTIGGYLGKDYVVESSIGHIRDLPNNAADTPAKIKDKPWGRLAVDVDNGFEPYYVVPRDKKSHIAKLKKLVKDADALYLATDEDREGEAIAWHLLDELKPPKGLPVHRMVFHEITKPAILAAVENPREINDDLVEAQEARRILDRLYGYEVSPGAVEEGHVRPLRRPRAVRRDPPGGRQGARADEVPRRLLLGHRRHLRRRHRPRPADVPRQALQRRRRARRPRLRLRQHRRAQGQGRARPPLPRRRRVAGHRPRRHDVRRPLGRVQALPPLAVRRPSAPPRCSRRPAASSG